MNYLQLSPKFILTTCCITVLIISTILPVTNGLRNAPLIHHNRFKTYLQLVNPDDATVITSSVNSILQGIGFSSIPALDLTRTDGLSFLNPLLTNGVSSLGFFNILDAAKFPFLPREAHEFLLTLPVIVRVAVGFFTLDVLPTVADILFLKLVWSKFIAVRRPYREINIDDLPKIYNVEEIAAFYEKKPRLVLARASEIVVLAKDFLFGLLSDYQKGILKSNQPARAIQYTTLITTLGPTFIKVGQALSIRPDLASPAYLEELVKLQDQVPPFSSVEALKIIEQEMGGLRPESVFESLAAFEKPVAAASLGQVYKVKLKSTGVSVAVKVQRPDMLLTVSLDLYIVRNLLRYGMLIPKITDECRGLISVVDNWAGRFLEELDYEQELDSSEKFKLQMSDRSTTMGDSVVVPMAYREYSSKKLLVSEWIDGTKLSKIDTTTEKGKDTVRKLTRVLLNSYLVQLLETGYLHADPHPGNFLVTSAGKLCILDYGLMTTVDEDKRFALLEFVSNLLAKDYDATLDGLAVLGFVPDEIVNDPVKRKIVAPLLAGVFKQISNGGGAFTINIGEITNSLGSLSNEYPLVIPPYFGLILRAFGSLEGLGLSVDREYSIVKECFPYLSRRLLSDDSVRIRVALRTFLYGTKGRLDIDRVDELAEGYRSFAAIAASAASGKAFEELRFVSLDSPSSTSSSTSIMVPSALDPGSGMKLSDNIDPGLSSAARIIFSKQGNYVQELLLDEAVRIADALSRSIVSSAVAAATQQPLVVGSMFLRNALLSGSTSLLSTQRGAKRLNSIFPFTIAAQEIEGVFSLSPDDIETLRTLKRLLQILAGVDNGKGNYRKNHEAGTVSTGLIDADDFALVQQVLIQFSASMKPEQWSSAALSLLGGNNQKNDPDSLRSQIISLIPLLRDSAPGATSLAIRFGRRLVGKSVGRLNERIESYNSQTQSQQLDAKFTKSNKIQRKNKF